MLDSYEIILAEEQSEYIGYYSLRLQYYKQLIR